MNIYETDHLLDEYLLFHYGADDEVLPWSFGPRDALGFARRSVNQLLDPALLAQPGRALDLGCAVGRSSYELAAVCGEVIGIDYSRRFVEAAENIRRLGSVNYSRIDEAARGTELVAAQPAAGDPSRIRFEQGDAMSLRDDLGSFDVVHAANLLCRLGDPQKLLDRLPSLVRTGGQLLLTTPCTWLAEFTPQANWPRGSTFGWLEEKLGRHFSLSLRADLPFLIREHARKFQWSVALGTRWVRR
jgi:putative 4-mercaptohistidine N1-methyltranferase